MEVLNDDLDLLADVGWMQSHPPHQALTGGGLLHLAAVAAPSFACDFQRGVVGLVALEHVEDVLLLDGLAHRVQMKLDRLAIRAWPAEQFEGLVLRCRGEREVGDVFRLGPFGHFRGKDCLDVDLPALLDFLGLLGGQHGFELG